MSTQKYPSHLSDGQSANETVVKGGESSDKSYWIESLLSRVCQLLPHKTSSSSSPTPPTPMSQSANKVHRQENATSRPCNGSLGASRTQLDWRSYRGMTQQKCANLIKSTSRSFWIVCLVLCALTSLFILIQIYLNYAQTTTTTTATATTASMTGRSTSDLHPMARWRVFGHNDPNILVYPMNLVNSTLAKRARAVLNRRRRRSVGWMHAIRGPRDMYPIGGSQVMHPSQAQARALDQPTTMSQGSGDARARQSTPAMATSLAPTAQDSIGSRASFGQVSSPVGNTRWTPIVKQLTSTPHQAPTSNEYRPNLASATTDEKLVSNTRQRPSAATNRVPAKQSFSHKSLVTATITSTPSAGPNNGPPQLRGAHTIATAPTTQQRQNNALAKPQTRGVVASSSLSSSSATHLRPADGQSSSGAEQPNSARRQVRRLQRPRASQPSIAAPTGASLDHGASLANHHWRRPRFQHSEQPIYHQTHGGKVYKRVLLCDKTLVSLDYLRRYTPKEQAIHTNQVGGPMASHYAAGAPINSELADEFSADNFIDLDANFATSSEPMADMLRSNETATVARRMLRSGGGGAVVGERRSGVDQAAASHHSTSSSSSSSSSSYLLPDDEPLVKCDMWDLEKGLKNRKPPLHLLQQAIRADFDTVRDAINRCRQLSERVLPPEDEYRGDGLEIMSTEDLMSLFSMKRGLLPGTKWCGLGDQADSYNDLGPKHRIDICCRAHDHCPIRSKPFRNDYGILNIGLYTKSHCDCDADFYRCLREARSRTADMLGNLYFNVMKLQCMREERMKVCRQVKPIALGFERCIRYEDSNLKRVFKFTSPPVAY